MTGQGGQGGPATQGPSRTGLRARLKEARLAALLLTRLPVGRLRPPAPRLASARWAYPLAGAAVGLVAGATFALASLALPALPAALLALTASALLTGALHEDGLADYADGAGAGGDRERRLAIMADSRMGSYGALALVLSVGLRASAIAALAPGLPAFVAIAAASRAAMLALQEALPPARTEGLGAQAAGARDWRGPVGLLLGLASLALLGAPGFAVALAMLCVTAALGAHAHRHLGGQTGDTLGTAQQLAETAGWLALLSLAAA